jgi:hypothetical protein
MKQNETLAFCGLYCGGCKNFKENMNCLGCRYEENLVNDCPTRLCAIEKGLRYCGECKEFPCPLLKEFYEDGFRHHKLAYQNVLRMNEIGIEKWLIEQENEHTCQCGKKKYWFATICNHGNEQ